MSLLDLIPAPYRIAAELAMVAVLAAGVAWFVHHERELGRDEGRAEVRARWDKETARLTVAALAESQAKAKESIRRVDQQQRNQNAQDAEMAALRVAAARNAADADRVRSQSVAAAREWTARLADTPARADLDAAGAAITVLADVRGRLDSAAGELAAYAGAAHEAGLKCERDYQALTTRKVSP